MSSVRSIALLRATRPRHPQIPNSQHRNLINTHLSSTSTSTSPFHNSHHGRRAFHWQSAATSAIEGTQSLIVELHSVTHLPWFLTIPLVAFTVGAVFRLPFTIYTQHIIRERTQFNTLLQAWNARIQKDVAREGIPRSQGMSEVKKRQDQALKRIYKKVGLQQWRIYGSFLSFPFWLVAIDAVRRLCGGPTGLIGSLIVSSSPSTTASSIPETATNSTLDPSTITTALETAQKSLPDPSLTYEGCLWFTDLTQSDPYHILPIALSISLVYNLLPKSGSTSTTSQLSDRINIALGRRPKSQRAQTLADIDDKVAWKERMKSTLYLSMVGLGALVGPLTMDLPAALHLYWLASSATNALSSKAVRYSLPVDGKLMKRCTNVELPVIRPRRDLKTQTQ